MKNVLSILVVAGVAAAASAQVTSPVISWQVSTDNGATWSSNAVLNSAGTVKVRGVGSWSGTGGLALGAVAFDGTILNTSAGDSVTGISAAKNANGDAGSFFDFSRSSQSLSYVASTFGTTIKIDDSTDVSAPGAGTKNIVAGQSTLQFGGTNVNTANPVTFFVYDLSVDGTAGVRTISSLLKTTSAMSVYTTTGGLSTRFNASVIAQNSATVEVLIPTPGTLALAGLGGLAAARRRR